MAVLIAGLLAMVGARAAITVDSVRLHRAPDHTRIVFDLPEPVEHTLDKLADPDRVVVDLMDADLAFDVSALDYKDSPIENIRVGKHEDKTRVVFDLSAAVRPRTNLLKPVDPHSWRLVVDLFDSDPKPVKTIEEPEADSGEPRQMIVAIDPGHGGEDPGALGPGNLLEKEVVLQIARKVKARIDREPGMKAVMVRDGDYYVPLAERRRVARQDNHADVFISIHADAFTDPRAHGASVFALSNRGATSARAAYVAKMANESDKVAGVYEEEKDDSNLLNGTDHQAARRPQDRGAGRLRGAQGAGDGLGAGGNRLYFQPGRGAQSELQRPPGKAGALHRQRREALFPHPPGAGQLVRRPAP